MENKKRCCRPPKFLIPLFIIAAILIFGAIVMLLWNAILPDLLHVNRVNYWQAVGLLILCKILFGGFKGKGGPGKFDAQHRIREKIKNMSPEEKEKFKEEWRRRFRGHC